MEKPTSLQYSTVLVGPAPDTSPAHCRLAIHYIHGTDKRQHICIASHCAITNLGLDCRFLQRVAAVLSMTTSVYFVVDELGEIDDRVHPLTLWAFYNVTQFSCSRPTNQIAVFSRLNWFTL
jgi:hypothetical protein